MEKIPKALVEVRKWKREVSRRTAGMTIEQEIAYFRNSASDTLKHTAHKHKVA